MSKVNYKNTRTSMRKRKKAFTPFSRVSIFDFEQVNANCVINLSGSLLKLCSAISKEFAEFALSWRERH